MATTSATVRQMQIEKEIARVDALLEVALSRLSEGIDWSGDLVDKANRLVDRTKVAARYRLLEERRSQLERAKMRVEQGVGEICEGCGRPISEERLEAVIEATRCRECQQRVDQQRHRIEAHMIAYQAA